MTDLPPPPGADLPIPPGFDTVDGVVTKYKAAKLKKVLAKCSIHLGPTERLLLVADLSRVRAPSTQVLLVTDQRLIGAEKNGKLGFVLALDDAFIEAKSQAKLNVGASSTDANTYDAFGNTALGIAAFVAAIRGEKPAPPAPHAEGDEPPAAAPATAATDATSPPAAGLLSVAAVVDGVRVPPKMKAKSLQPVMDAVRARLGPSEELLFVADATRVRAPASSFIAVTNHRVMLLDTTQAEPRITWSGSGGEVRAFARTTSLVLHGPENEQLKVMSSDATVHELAHLIDNLPPVSAEQRARYEAIAAEEAAGQPLSKDAAAAWMAGLPIHGSRPNAASARIIHEHSGGEDPWFVLGGVSGAGVLAAFEDRLMIVKAGAMTGLMSGTLGGHRATTFPYAEITGIEYNAGMMNGVLEILTASYQGTANKDYWRGTHRSRNADANDPWTLSNTLPLEKGTQRLVAPQLNELRKRIAESKQRVIVQQAPSPQNSLASELAELGRLRDRGVLSEEEFAAAKGRLLGASRPTPPHGAERVGPDDR